MKQRSAISDQQSAKGLILFAIWAVAFLFSFLGQASALDGNNLEQELRAKYQGQVVMLRNFYCGRKLQFDLQGNLVGYAQSGAWTLCRDVKIEELKVRNDKLRIAGHRVYLRYDASQKQFLDVTLYEKAKHADVNGRAVRLQVELPLGMGLDEQAAAKISSWKFNPAKKDGQPVPVALNVQTSFNLY